MCLVFMVHDLFKCCSLLSTVYCPIELRARNEFTKTSRSAAAARRGAAQAQAVIVIL